MSASTFIFEKNKLSEAIKYANSLVGCIVNGIVSVDEIPCSIPSAIERIIRVDSVAEKTIPQGIQINELSAWVTDGLNEYKDNRFLFKPNQIYWKFWIDVNVLDMDNFVLNYFNVSNVKDFYLADINGKIIKALLDEEYKFYFYTRLG